jgi:hypothetical protein
MSSFSLKAKLAAKKNPSPKKQKSVTVAPVDSVPPALLQAAPPVVPQVVAIEGNSLDVESSLHATISNLVTLERRSTLDSDVAGSEEELKILLQQQSDLDNQEAFEKAKAASLLEQAALAEKRAFEDQLAAAAENEKLARLAALKTKIASLQESIAKRHKVDQKADAKPGDSIDFKKSKPSFTLPMVLGSSSSSSVSPGTERKDTDGEFPPVVPLRIPPGHLTLPMGHHSLTNPFSAGNLFVPSRATLEDIDSLSNLASTSDYGAAAAAFTAIELFQGLLLHVTSIHPVTSVRSSKIRSSSIMSKEPVSEEIALTKLISMASCHNLVLRVMMNPRAMLSLNCFLPSNRAHFNWVEETTNGQKKPFLLPFPASLTGRELLLIFHQFTLLVTVVDAFFGVSLSHLYKVVEDLLLAGEPPLAAAKYIEEERQNVFLLTIPP